MEQFSIEKYLQNPNIPVVTRDGRSARIICTDRKFEFSNAQYPVIALIKSLGNNDERALSFTSNGKEEADYDGMTDLFFAPGKKSGWVNIYRTTFGTQVGKIYNSKEDAETSAKDYGRAVAAYVATIKIEWEE